MAVKGVLELIGRTPLVRLNKIVPTDSADIFAKIESFNPGGSVKDRIALWMIEDAERKKLLKAGSTIIEPTSGNTGIGLAMVGAVKGYKVILVMPDTMSVERRRLLDSYGAEIVFTPGVEGMEGAINKAGELIKSIANSFMPQQFNNPVNPIAHRKTTAREILKQMKGRIDAFIAGVGTGGTITGVGEALKERFPRVKIYAVEPSSSAVLSGGTKGTHRIQGIGAGFVPKVLNRRIIDEVIAVSDEDAFRTSLELLRREGISAGISAGAACWASLEAAEALGKGKKIVTVFPDGAERYLSIRELFK